MTARDFVSLGEKDEKEEEEHLGTHRENFDKEGEGVRLRKKECGHTRTRSDLLENNHSDPVVRVAAPVDQAEQRREEFEKDGDA